MTRPIGSFASGATAMAFCLAIAGAGANASEARAADLMVRYDQSQLLRLPRPPTEVIIGNPSIADVAIQGGNLLVVTGKSFGVTNIIALDAQRNVIQDQRVVVDHDDLRRLSLYKGSKREVLYVHSGLRADHYRRRRRRVFRCHLQEHAGQEHGRVGCRRQRQPELQPIKNDIAGSAARGWDPADCNKSLSIHSPKMLNCRTGNT